MRYIFLQTAFYQPSPARHKILIESRSFPSDHYAIESQIQLKGGKVEESLVCMEPREVTLNFCYFLNDFKSSLHLWINVWTDVIYNKNEIILHQIHWLWKFFISVWRFQGEECLRIEDVLSFIENHGESVSIIFFSGIQYYTGQLFDMNTITAAGHRKAHFLFKKLLNL